MQVVRGAVCAIVRLPTGNGWNIVAPVHIVWPATPRNLTATVMRAEVPKIASYTPKPDTDGTPSGQAAITTGLTNGGGIDYKGRLCEVPHCLSAAFRIAALVGCIPRHEEGRIPPDTEETKRATHWTRNGRQGVGFVICSLLPRCTSALSCLQLYPRAALHFPPCCLCIFCKCLCQYTSRMLLLLLPVPLPILPLLL